MSTLADRIRGIVAPGPKGSGLPRPVPPCALADVPDAPELAAVLGGDWRDGEAGPCFVVETRIEPGTIDGTIRVENIAKGLEEAAHDAPLMAAGAPARPPFVFFDLETTGLMSGAGTYAFLVGCGAFAADGGFVTRQFLLTRFTDERPLLASVRTELERAGTLVSFNGKSFDAPVLETRYLFHRLEWIGGTLPHLDMLHPARRLWGSIGRLSEHVGRPFQGRQDDCAPCSLLMLEQQILGVRRVGDVPGFEIPARYFRFVRSGDARPLVAVLEHNRRDLLSLAGLTTRLLHLVGAGAAAAHDAYEALALGAIYTRAGLDGRAHEAYTRALTMVGHSVEPTSDSIDPIKLTALRALALLSRRARRYSDAAEYWQQLLELRACPPHLMREATEALAIHHEHRVRDLKLAKTFALRILESGPRSAWADAVMHRIARIDRKLKTTGLQLACPMFPTFQTLPTFPTFPPSLSGPSPRSCGSRTSGPRTSS